MEGLVLRYYGAAVTDVGIKKKTNQDSVCLKVAQHKDKGQVAMCIVCDGMGGLEKGEVASATVIRRFSNWFEQQLAVRLADYTWHQLSTEWDRMIKSENQRLIDYGIKLDTSLGTTFSGILVIEDKYMIAHVGDSRIYCIDTEVKQLTEDQTFVEREIKRGNMTREQAAVDSRRNVLLQCVGASQNVEPQFLYGDVKTNMVFMLCSDGFRHVLETREIYDAFRPETLYDITVMEQNGLHLIDIVKGRGEKDNISVALLKCV